MFDGVCAVSEEPDSCMMSRKYVIKSPRSYNYSITRQYNILSDSCMTLYYSTVSE